MEDNAKGAGAPDALLELREEGGGGRCGRKAEAAGRWATATRYLRDEAVPQWQFDVPEGQLPGVARLLQLVPQRIQMAGF